MGGYSTQHEVEHTVLETKKTAGRTKMYRGIWCRTCVVMLHTCLTVAASGKSLPTNMDVLCLRVCDHIYTGSHKQVVCCRWFLIDRSSHGPWRSHLLCNVLPESWHRTCTEMPYREQFHMMH
jgi:hypothetical protein